MSTSSRPRGYTLIELLTVIAVSGILGLTATTVLIGQRTFLTTEGFSAGNLADTARAAETVGELAKVAQAVVASRDFTVNGSGQTFTSDNDTLILQLPALDAAGNPSTTVSDYALITLDPVHPQRLLLVMDADGSSVRRDGTRLLHGHVTSFNVLYNANPAASSSQITATLRGRTDLTNRSAPETTAEFSTRLRNH